MPAIRYVPERDIHAMWREKVEALKGKVEIIEGALDHGVFRNMIKKTHVVILPYDPEKFKGRPSGLLVDALLAAKPVIALKKSWLGNRIEEYDSGIALDTLAPDSVLRALQDIRRNYSYYVQRAREAGERYMESNSWSDLAISIFLPSQIPELTQMGIE